MAGDAHAKALSALARVQLRESSVGDTLQRIAEITLEAIPPAAIAGMTMLGDDGRPTTAVYTDVASPEIDEAQYREDAGPCLDAWRQQRIVRVGDVDAVADRYPGFVTACRAHGVRSTLSMPIVGGDEPLGALNLYAHEAGGFEDAEEIAADLAVAAGSVLANASAYRSAVELGEQLAEAMRSRAVIEQAKGILMAQSPDLTVDAAFDVLRKASQRENVKLRDIAQRLVDRRQLPAHEETDRPWPQTT